MPSVPRANPESWLVQGLLLADNTFVRSPAFMIDAPALPATRDQATPVRVEALDAKGKVLLRSALDVSVPCGDTAGTAASFRFVSGAIALPQKTASVRFLLDDGIVLEDYLVPKGSPKVSLLSVPKPNAQGLFTLKWKSEHPSSAPLTHAIGFSADDGKRWQPVGLPTHANWLEFDLDLLPGGDACRFCLKTTDGIHTVSATSRPFTLRVKSCVAMILAPESQTRVRSGAPLRLRGQGYWLEERRPEFDALFWSSSLVGAMGRGAEIEVQDLPAGKHDITLTAGEGDRAGRSTIQVVVSD